MTEELSSPPFAKGSNEGRSAFFTTVSPALGQLLDLSKSNWVTVSSLQLFAQQENSNWLWCGDHATFNIEFVSVTVEWALSSGESLLLLCRCLSVRLSRWSAQGNAALWLQQISVIIFEVDVAAEQKQTYWSQCVCFYNFPLSLCFYCSPCCTFLPASLWISFLAYYICKLSVTLLTNVLKNSFGMISDVFLTKQKKIMACCLLPYCELGALVRALR